MLTAVSPTIRLIWVVVGLLSTALGFVGVVLPLLPTVPFMILAAFCFAKGSPRLHSWMLRHPQFGSAITHWSRHRAISYQAKQVASVSMSATLLFSVAAGISWKFVAAQAVVLACAAVFVLTRPSPP